MNAARAASDHEPLFQPITTQAQLDVVLARALAGIRDEYDELRRTAAQVNQGTEGTPAGARGSSDARGSGDPEGPR